MADEPPQAGTLPIPVQVALGGPRSESQAAPPVLGVAFGQPTDPSPLTDESFGWADHGLEPRWLGQESSDCAAALQASVFHTKGGQELDRFLAGAQARSEVALLINTLGDADESRTTSIFGGGASLLLPGMSGMVNARPTPSGVQPRLAENLSSPDRDLGLRLLSQTGELAWHSLSLSATSLQKSGGAPEHVQAAGRLDPILVDGLGAPLVAAWVSDEPNARWYVLPGGADWHLLLDWLVTRALAEYAPGALRRSRTSLGTDPAVQSSREIAAHEALEALQAEYESQLQSLRRELAAARAEAEPLREGLLHGTADQLAAAVGKVLQAAGCQVIDLDHELGDTTSADLLVSYEDQSRLVEVKAASGNASEQLVGALYRHLETWPQLRPDLPVVGGVLVVNHQHRRDPAERDPQVYSRAEFVRSLRVPVIASRALLDWWRVSDWQAMRTAIFERS